MLEERLSVYLGELLRVGNGLQDLGQVIRCLNSIHGSRLERSGLSPAFLANAATTPGRLATPGRPAHPFSARNRFSTLPVICPSGSSTGSAHT